MKVNELTSDKDDEDEDEEKVFPLANEKPQLFPPTPAKRGRAVPRERLGTNATSDKVRRPVAETDDKVTYPHEEEALQHQTDDLFVPIIRH